MKEKIDILMATYNGEKYIHEQIESIINQTYKNWRLLISDDGSVDGTVEIIKKYIKKDKRIELIEDNLGNLGVVKKFRELLKRAEADYIMFSDQDDIWLNNKIERTLNEVFKFKERIEAPLLIHSDSFIMNNDTKVKKKRFLNNLPLKKG
jgi:rhamnosyltransferase